MTVPRHRKLRKEYEKWSLSVLEPFLKRTGEIRDTFRTTSGAAVDRLYLPPEEPEERYLSGLGFPGQFPFTRGVYPTMYRGRPWTMRQYAGFGDAEETNRRFKYLLAQGQTGLSVAFDLCTQIGYDSDHEMSGGEVGRVGVAVDSLRDMERIFHGIPLGEVSTSMTINAPASVLLAMYVAVGEKQKVPRQKLGGTVQNDILKEYAARGTYIFPPAPSLRLVTDLIAFCSAELPRFNAISVSGYHMREAGCTAAQEVGFTLANGIAYVQAAQQAGIEVDRFAKRISFFFAAHNDLFEEVAKYRAARRLWARIMRERFDARSPDSMMLRFHVQTAGCTLTAQQPQNNIARVAIQALAAAAGGAQSLHTNSFDEALGLPSEAAATVALRTQQIIAHESGMANTIDPFGGSYFLEALTDRVEEEATAYIDRIDGLGGAVRAIEHGYVQREIQEASYRYQLEVESRRRIVVGLNDHISEGGEKPGLLRIDEELERRQIERLRRLRAERDASAAGKRLRELSAAAGSRENLMPFILEAVRCYCTIGEIAGVLREVFGEHRERDFL
jgi:methylmalonyl-CoA mutase N-terminal domain/subunit